MRLNLSQQYIDNLKLIGLDLNMILELSLIQSPSPRDRG